MTSRADVDAFLSSESLALAGAKRSGKGMGNYLLRELAAKGYRVHPVHPEADVLEGRRCYRSLAELPEKVDGAVLCVPPPQALELVRQAADAGIARVWMQQGAESPEAMTAARERGVTAIGGECLLMFVRDTAFFHRAHRFFRGLAHRLPA